MFLIGPHIIRVANTCALDSRTIREWVGVVESDGGGGGGHVQSLGKLFKLGSERVGLDRFNIQVLPVHFRQLAQRSFCSDVLHPHHHWSAREGDDDDDIEGSNARVLVSAAGWLAGDDE